MSETNPIGELAAALAKAQGAMKPAIFDRENPFFKSRYATLASVWEACRAALSANGLAVTQIIDVDEGRLTLETTLMHSSGQEVVSHYPITPVKNDPQGIGSALTYARRYSLSALVGVASEEEDDGNAASGTKASAPKEKSMPAKPVETPAARVETAAAILHPDSSTPDEPPPPVSVADAKANLTASIGVGAGALFAKKAIVFAKAHPRYADKSGKPSRWHILKAAPLVGYMVFGLENMDAAFKALEARALSLEADEAMKAQAKAVPA